jgi:hypothetical protein
MDKTTFSQLTDKQSGVTMEVYIIRVDPITDVVDRKGKQRKVVHCLVWDSEDKEGYLTLWDKEIPMAIRDIRVKLVNGYHWIYHDPRDNTDNHNLSSGTQGMIRKCL